MWYFYENYNVRVDIIRKKRIEDIFFDNVVVLEIFNFIEE